MGQLKSGQPCVTIERRSLSHASGVGRGTDVAVVRLSPLVPKAPCWGPTPYEGVNLSESINDYTITLENILLQVISQLWLLFFLIQVNGRLQGNNIIILFLLHLLNQRQTNWRDTALLTKDN